MPINAGPEYIVAEREYNQARGNSDKLKASQKMLQTAPKHKSSEVLIAEIKGRISKIKKLMEKEKQSKKGSGFTYSIKREGSAQIVIVGSTNSGKSTLLNKLTGARVQIADYPFTTKKPEIGVMDYKGVKIQLIEIPALFENFEESKLGPTFMSIIKQADLIILMFNTAEEKKMLDKELKDVNTPIFIYNEHEDIKDGIWRRLNLIKIYSKQPGKEKENKPMTLEKGSTIRDFARTVHKDFVDKFKYARIWGKSVKFNGASVGLEHVLEDDDVVELHTK